MKLTAKVKLLCTPDEKAILDPLKEANQACSAISGMAWDGQTFKQYDFHRLVYRYPRALPALNKNGCQSDQLGGRWR